MRTRLALPLTALVSAAVALALPSLERKATTTSAWRLTTSALARQTDAATPTFPAPARIIGKNFGRRIFLIHGLPGYENYWDVPERQSLLDALLRTGAQVVILRLPDAQPGFFKTGGGGYCQAFSHWFNTMAGDIESRYGAAEEYTVGISYGGYHAMLAGVLPRIDGWIAISPVTDISRLAEFRFQSNDACQADSAVLGRKPGLIVFGRDDQRVGSDLIEAKVAEIQSGHRANFLAVKVPAPNHAMTPPMVERAATWYENQRQNQ